MKKVIKNVFFAIFAIIGAALFGVLACSAPVNAPETAQVAEAYSIYDMLTPQIVTFYEKNISKEPVVSSIRPQKLERMAAALNIETKKMTAILLVQDLAAKTGKKIDIKTLASMSDGEMIRAAKSYGSAYIDTLSDAEKEQLKKNFRNR